MDVRLKRKGNGKTVQSVLTCAVFSVDRRQGRFRLTKWESVI